MTQVDSRYKAIGLVDGFAFIKNESQSIGTSTTVLIERSSEQFNGGEFLFYNGNATETVTYKIWGSPIPANDSSAISLGDTNYATQWKEITNDVSVSSLGTEHGYWQGKYVRIGVTATSTALTSNDNDVFISLFKN